jgi:Na+/H+ antiporter NhaC
MARPYQYKSASGLTRPVLLLTSLVLLIWVWTTLGQTSPAPSDSAAVATVASPEETYGLWTLLPALSAIVLAVVSRQVVLALASGILVGAVMSLPWTNPVPAGEWAYNPLLGLHVAVNKYVVEAVADADHVRIMMFTLIIAGMVGIMAANGGTAAMVNLVAPWACNRRRCQLVGWLAGLVVFFDDYANAMIVGPTMRPITDRMQVSREKLAYIVDSTAAPVASIALVGTWLGAEVQFIQEGFNAWTEQTRPAFLEGVSGFSAFYYSIPYRYYPIFALVLVFLVAIAGRDFGPMLKAERREAGEKGGTVERTGVSFGSARRWWYAAVPIAGLVVTTLVLLFVTGRSGLQGNYDSLRVLLKDLLADADPYGSIMYGALAGAALAVLITQSTGTLKLGKTMDAVFEGMSRVFRALVVLVMAWGLSSVTQDLHVPQVATSILRESHFSAHLLPLVVFVSSCVVAFATGTSWGTMGILCPVVVAMAGGLASDLPHAEALHLFYASVGSVLAGAIFGDHCSPISDTTVLSSLATECTLEAHVWTQMPYALLAAGLEIVVGDLLCSYTGLPPWIGLVMGVVVLVVFLRVFGKRVGNGSRRTS